MKKFKSKLKDKDLQKVSGALNRAAEAARKLADFYGTKFITRSEPTEKNQTKSQIKKIEKKPGNKTVKKTGKKTSVRTDKSKKLQKK